MDNITNKTRLAEKQKTKKTTKLQKQYELNKRIKLIRKQTEENKEIKQNERGQQRQILIYEDVDSGRFFK